MYFASVLIGLTSVTSAGLAASPDQPRMFAAFCGEIGQRQAALPSAPEPAAAFADFRGGTDAFRLLPEASRPSFSFQPLMTTLPEPGGTLGFGDDDGRYQQPPPPGTDLRLGAGGRADATDAELLRAHPMDFPIVPLPSTGLLAAVGLITTAGYRRRA